MAKKKRRVGVGLPRPVPEEPDIDEQSCDTPPQLRQKVLVLVGVPGAGKSTIAQQLREAGWVVVNQDVLGSRRSCEAAFDEALQAGRNVVVDRCNFDEAQRSTWVQLSLEYSSSLSTQAAAAGRPAGTPPHPGWAGGGGEAPGVLLIALELDLPLALCIQRVKQRRGHPTLPPSMAREVVERMASQWQAVDLSSEGFHKVLRVEDSLQLQPILASLLQPNDLSTTTSPYPPQATALSGPPTPTLFAPTSPPPPPPHTISSHIHRHTTPPQGHSRWHPTAARPPAAARPQQ